MIPFCMIDTTQGLMECWYISTKISRVGTYQTWGVCYKPTTNFPAHPLFWTHTLSPITISMFVIDSLRTLTAGKLGSGDIDAPLFQRSQ